MAKQTWKGGALLAPLPAVLVTSGDMENSNILTIAWTGIINTIPPKTYISVRKTRHSYEMIDKSGEFVINLTTADMAKKVDYCGIYTGKKVDKFKKCNFTKEEAKEVSAPVIGECPLALECKVCEKVELGTHDMFIADIVATDVEESLLDKNGKLDLSRANLMAFAHGEYYALGKKLSGFGDSAKKKKKAPPKKK
ncbi:MAG: flavin reductase family protein [Clostridia bacterium]|nr:flavin reductase family protein [Clostridia bacterium]